MMPVDLEQAGAPPATEAATDALVAIVGCVRHLVDHPEAVQVRAVPLAHRTILELRCARTDVGQVLGRAGHLITSVRALLAAVAGRQRIAVELVFVTEEEVFREKRLTTRAG